MEILGLVIGALLVIIVISALLLYSRFVPQRSKPVRRGDGRYSIGPVDQYGWPHEDTTSHGGPY